MPLTTSNLYHIRGTIELDLNDTLESFTERTLQISWVKKLLQALRQQTLNIPSSIEGTPEPTMDITLTCYRLPQSSFPTLHLPDEQLGDARMVIRLILYKLITQYSSERAAFQNDSEFNTELHLTGQDLKRKLQNIPTILLPPLSMAPFLNPFLNPRLIIHEKLNKLERFFNANADFMLLFLSSALGAAVAVPYRNKPLSKAVYFFLLTANLVNALGIYNARPYVAEGLFFFARRREAVPSVSHNEALTCLEQIATPADDAVTTVPASPLFTGSVRSRTTASADERHALRAATP